MSCGIARREHIGVQLLFDALPSSMDPVHAGVMIILALNISLMTPPVGACLFVLASVTGERIERVARSPME